MHVQKTAQLMHQDFKQKSEDKYQKLIYHLFVES